MAQKATRQHSVPRSYIARWSVSGKVHVRWRDGRSYATNPINVAVETGMYDLRTATGRSSVIDDAMTDIESFANIALREVDASEQPPIPGSEARTILSVFIAVQMSRTTEAREEIAFPARVLQFLAGRPLSRHLVADYLREQHLRAEPRDAEVEGAYTVVRAWAQEFGSLPQEAILGQMMDSVAVRWPIISGMNWTLEIDRKRRLITSDSPVSLWRALTYQDAYRAFGLNNAEEVRFPLGPDKLLVLSHRSTRVTARMAGDRARTVNAYAAAACYQFVIGRSDQREAIQALRMAQHRPVSRFNVAPGFTVGSNGEKVPLPGEILHMWTPNSDLEPPPPPRARPRRRRA